MGVLSRWIGASLRDTANVTVFRAGDRANVIPAVATAEVDARVLPGREAAFRAEVDALLGPDVECEWNTLPPVESPYDRPVVDAMAAAIAAEDPGATILPYLTAGATDAKSLAQLGIHPYGFAPLRLPPDLDFTALFHGVDERVPIDSLQFTARVLDRFLRAS
jgi:acetylornithine deacetylase/succinyl-diaminopimelate desuccinylase-like protein